MSFSRGGDATNGSASGVAKGACASLNVSAVSGDDG
jgi:hypothetical protein